MILEALGKFNFLDFVLVIIFLRVCYIAAVMGLSIEIFKLGGVLFSSFIALHYYTYFSDLIMKKSSAQVVPLDFMDFMVFIFLIAAGYLSFVLLRNLLFRFVQLNAIPKINQFLGLLLGILRGFLVVGLIAFTLTISSVNYLSSSVKHSYLGSQAFEILPQTYGWLWNNIFSKFLSKEKFNPVVTQTVEKFKENETN